jgi:hypothetical protein
MAGQKDITITQELSSWLGWLSDASFFPDKFQTMSSFSQTEIIKIMIFILICVFHKNSIEMKDNLRLSPMRLAFTSTIGVWAIYNINRVSEFIYFNF